VARFGKRSLGFLGECHATLRKFWNRLIALYDFSLLEAYRGKEKQEQYFRNGLTQLHFPHGNHNKMPSWAAHALPYPVIWPPTAGEMLEKLDELVSNKEKRNYIIRSMKEYGRIYHFIGYGTRLAEEMKINIRNGADWNKDKDILDNNFDDLSHWEMTEDV